MWAYWIKTWWKSNIQLYLCKTKYSYYMIVLQTNVKYVINEAIFPLEYIDFYIKWIKDNILFTFTRAVESLKYMLTKMIWFKVPLGFWQTSNGFFRKFGIREWDNMKAQSACLIGCLESYHLSSVSCISSLSLVNIKTCFMISLMFCSRRKTQARKHS